MFAIQSRSVRQSIFQYSRKEVYGYLELFITGSRSQVVHILLIVSHYQGFSSCQYAARHPGKEQPDVPTTNPQSLIPSTSIVPPVLILIMWMDLVAYNA